MASSDIKTISPSITLSKGLPVYLYLPETTDYLRIEYHSGSESERPSTPSPPSFQPNINRLIESYKSGENSRREGRKGRPTLW